MLHRFHGLVASRCAGLAALSLALILVSAAPAAADEIVKLGADQAAIIFVVAVGLPSDDSDTYWQIASGLWMLDHGELLRHDVFSSTLNGAHLGIGDWLGRRFCGCGRAVVAHHSPSIR